MARFRALNAATGSDFDPVERQLDWRRSAGAPYQSVLPPFVPEIDLERYARIKKATLRGVEQAFVTESMETARRLVCQCPRCSPGVDASRLSVTARYLVSEAHRVGAFNYRAALRRANVDRYLEVMSPRWTVRSAKQMRLLLYVAARVVHPREYPLPGAPTVERAVRTPPISADKIGRLHAIATALPAVQSRRLLLQLDLCYGAGARPGDLKQIRGSDITEASWDGEPVALVRLANHGGGTRTVPVADPDASRRLIAAAAERHDQYLMTMDGGSLGRNTANKAGEYLVRRGHEGFNAAELRHGWVMRMAQRVPAALLMQLADVKEVRMLADHQQFLPTYGVQHALALIKENWQ